MKNENQNRTPFFIIGRGRSGTDLLQRLLNTNPDVCVPPEATVLPLLHNKYIKQKNWNEKKITQFAKDVFLDDKIKNWWGLNLNEFIEYLNANQPSDYSEAILNLYSFYTEIYKPKAKFLGDKNPANSLYIDKILNVYPHAKFVVMVRNPIDNVYSFRNVQFDSNNTSVLAHRWNFYNREILNWSEKFSNQFHVVKFEDLINQTEKELVKISQFLDFSDDFDVSKIEKGDKNWQSNLGKEISSKHISKGLKNLSSSEIEKIENICGNIGQRLGCNLKGDKVSSFNLYAALFNCTEKYYVNLPLYLSSSIIRYYRNKKKLIVEN